MRTLRDIKYMLAILIASIAFVSCGGSGNRDRIPLLKDLEGLATVKPGENMTDYYTRDTIRAARRYSSSHNGTDILSGMDRKIFAKGAEMHSVDEKRNGDSAEVTVQIDRHPAVNMIGLRVRIPLKYESGRWKIDRSDMIPE